VQEVQEVHSNLFRIDYKNRDVIHAMEEQLTPLRTVDSRAGQNITDLVTIAELSNGTVSQMVKSDYPFSQKNFARLKDYGSSEGCTHNYEEIRIFRSEVIIETKLVT
jgi:hypothetical protein